MQPLRSGLPVRHLAGRQDLLDVAFFVVVPLVLSVTMAVVGRYVDSLGLRGGVLYVAALSFVPWWIAGITTQLAFVLLRPVAPALWVVAVLGVLSSAPFVSLYVQEVNHWFQTSWGGGHLLRELAWPNSADRVRDVLLSTGRAVALWTLFVVVFVNSFGWSRYSYAAGAPASGDGNTARARLQNSGSNWTREDDAELIALVHAAVPLRSIAARMKRTVPAIRTRMAKLKLKPLRQ